MAQRTAESADELQMNTILDSLELSDEEGTYFSSEPEESTSRSNTNDIQSSIDFDDALCDTCKEIGANFIRRGTENVVCSELVDERAGQGCLLCLCVLAHLKEEELDGMRKQRNRAAEMDWDFEIQYHIVGSDFFPSHFNKPWIWISYGICGEEAHFDVSRSISFSVVFRVFIQEYFDEDVFSALHEGPNVGDSTSSPSAWNSAERWLHDCTTDHDECRVSVQTNLPSRLLSLRSDRSTALHLITVSDLPCPPTYATLSHCWGNYLPLRLLTSNITNFMSGEALSDLPPTYSDAIEACHKLGIGYLWIDSLCIIQDSVTDWEQESARMGQIYLGGICNLAATAAFDARDGMFYPRDAQLFKPIKARINNPSEEVCYIFIRDIWSDMVEKAPLNSRAWVCQERLFSPRTLHFCKSQLAFECRELSACESLPTEYCELPRLADGPQSKKRWMQKIVHHTSDTEPNDIQNLLQTWMEFVELYSRCSITFQSDILVTFSGLAATFNAQLNTDYLAGLWRADLPQQLLWRAVGSGRRISTYVAPSWSWAAITSEVSFGLPPSPAVYDHDAEPLIDILEVNATPSTENAYGQVRDGLLLVKGRLAEVRFEYQKKNPVKSCKLYVRIDDFKEEATERSLIIRFDEDDYTLYNDVDFDQNIGDTELAVESLFILPVFDDFDGQSCLVLQKVRDGTRGGVFFRWGYLDLIGRTAVELLDGGLQSFDKRNSGRVNEGNSARLAKDGGHIIEII
ncbi:HET-domain-containing protein [Mollisia scopiformis]|uniref:HET-domain-containing protein n=1 Tax=Mollisia scopiformis TaxID=149040 RepID=A0A194X0T9_MOLSC|nr:HET-domain-containing protein [Mollisia scopiformis]KUJ13816.1 HET-domain-containing protein [Mollisia scopiformis]